MTGHETFVSTLIRKSGDVLKGNMKKIILCRGIQASGKSTFSKAWAQEAPKERVRFCYDDLRWMMGEYWVPSREGILGKLRDSFMAAAMEKGYDIIIDKTSPTNNTTCFISPLLSPDIIPSIKQIIINASIIFITHLYSIT